MKNRPSPVPQATGGHPLSVAFLHAINGVAYFLITERNGKIQAATAVIVIISGFYFHLSTGEWACILLCIGSVLMAEMMNTSIEYICNIVEPNYDIKIKQIKDMAAGAVFIITTISIIIGLIIFTPYLLKI